MLDNLDGPDSISLNFQSRTEAFPGKETFCFVQQLLFMPALPQSLPYRSRTCLGSPPSCLSLFLAVNLFTCISCWFRGQKTFLKTVNGAALSESFTANATQMQT